MRVTINPDVAIDRRVVARNGVVWEQTIDLRGYQALSARLPKIEEGILSEFKRGLCRSENDPKA